MGQALLIKHWVLINPGEQLHPGLIHLGFVHPRELQELLRPGKLTPHPQNAPGGNGIPSKSIWQERDPPKVYLAGTRFRQNSPGRNGFPPNLPGREGILPKPTWRECDLPKIHVEGTGSLLTSAWQRMGSPPKFTWQELDPPKTHLAGLSVTPQDWVRPHKC